MSVQTTAYVLWARLEPRSAFWGFPPRLAYLPRPDFVCAAFPCSRAGQTRPTASSRHWGLRKRVAIKSASEPNLHADSHRSVRRHVSDTTRLDVDLCALRTAGISEGPS